MKRPDPTDAASIEAWLDGRLEGREALAFQERLATDPELAAELELAERIQRSLRRSFVPHVAAPGAPDTRSAPATPPVLLAGPGSGPAFTWRRAAGVLAAAAGLLLILRLTGGGEEEPVTDELARSEAGLRLVPPGSPVGPLIASDSPDLAVSAPDLELLYEEAVADAAGTSAACGPEDDLGATLAAAHGERVTVTPEASQMLHGPYGSARWPTGSIYTGPGENPSVLVAERGATHRCCVLFELSEASELNLFTWQVGDLVLTEITPGTEPRLLGFFE